MLQCCWEEVSGKLNRQRRQDEQWSLEGLGEQEMV